MSAEDTSEKLIKKYPFLARNWLWIILVALIVAGMFYSAYCLYNYVRGRKETKNE